MNKTIAKTLLLATMVTSSGWGSQFVDRYSYSSRALEQNLKTIFEEINISVRAIQKETIPQLESKLEQKIKNVNDEIFSRFQTSDQTYRSILSVYSDISTFNSQIYARIDQLKTTVDTNKSELQIALEAATNRVSQLQAAFNTTNTTVAANKVAITNTVSQLQNVVTENNAALTNRIAQLENTVQMQNAVNLELKNRIE